MNDMERHILVELAATNGGYLDLDSYPICEQLESVSEAWAVALSAGKLQARGWIEIREDLSSRITDAGREALASQ